MRTRYVRSGFPNFGARQPETWVQNEGTEMKDPVLAAAQQYVSARAARQQCEISEQQWSFFYEAYKPLVYAMVRSANVPMADRDDCVQQVWLELVERLPRLNGNCNAFLVYLKKTVHSKVSDYFRRADKDDISSWRFDASDADQFGHDCTPESIYERIEVIELVCQTLEKLEQTVSDLNYRIFVMRSLREISVREIASGLNLSAPQVSDRNYRATARFRQLFEQLSSGE